MGDLKQRQWHIETDEEVIKQIGTTKQGLSQQEAQKRAQQYGKNTIEQEERFRTLKILLKNINNLLIYVLLVAALISYVLKDYIETYVILAVVVLTIALSFLQEYSADRTIKALAHLTARKVEVLREGRRQSVLAEDLVPGDIVLLRRGTIVPADIRVLESRGLTVDESILTGESVQKAKTTEPLEDQDLPVSDRENMAFASTAVTNGAGKGIVVATGLYSEIGRISARIKQLGTQKSPLQKKVETMSRQISFTVIAVALFLLMVLLMQDISMHTAVLLVGAVAIAGIPESFPLAMTLTLSRGVKRMADHKAVVKNLNSVETLGTTTVICSDKTGTLTENKMRVVQFVLSDNRAYTLKGKPYAPNQQFYHQQRPIKTDELPRHTQFFHACVLCNDAELQFKDGEWSLIGEPTEGALLTLAKSAGVDDGVLLEKTKRVHEVPFDPSKKYMITVHEHHGTSKKLTVSMKGAGERVLERCQFVRDAQGKKTKITPKQRQQFQKQIEHFTSEGQRVLAVASKEVQDTKEYRRHLEDHLHHEYTLEGIVGIEDPIRDDATTAVEECRSAGIRPVMITGDHRGTAAAIGERLGILNKQTDRVVEGVELDKMTDQQLDSTIDRVGVFARTTPEHKFRIVSSLQRKGEIVAMTGDGVNDAPALKKADIGVGMGKNGTEVAKEASDMILMDDRFATIVHAIREGRTIYSNIRRFVYYLLTVNFAQVGIIVTAVLLGFSRMLPLTPLMILFINIVTSTFPALALSIEPTHEKVMRQKPRDPKEKLLSRYILTKVTVMFPIMVVISLILFLWELQIQQVSLTKAMTMAFLAMVVTGALHTFNARRLHSTIFDAGFFRNQYVFLSVAFSLFLTMLVLSTTVGRELFGTVQLFASDWLIVMGCSLMVIVFSEIIKWTIRTEFEEQSALKGIKVHLE